MSSPAKRKAYKDWFDAAAADSLAKQIGTVHPAFPRKAFLRQALANIESLGFHGRVEQFSRALKSTLPEDTQAALAILTESLPPVLPDTEAVTDGWRQWPVGHFIGAHGLPHFEEAMVAIRELTRRFTSEFAIRPFIAAYPEKTLGRLLEWTADPCPHVRRLCSEGARPRLPWGAHLVNLIADPSPALPLLEALKDDPSLYVRRSVSNHLNDIARDHPETALSLAKAWSRGATAERQWIIRRGLRNLIKAGHPRALALLGFAPVEGLRTKFEVVPGEISIGESVRLRLTIENTGPAPVRLLLDYAVTYVRRVAGTGRKVFKWTTVELSPGQKETLEKRHPMRPTSVRALYPGDHYVEIQVNGISLDRAAFHLSDGTQTPN
jgi:3-methyladenine DNA glycosylase AlkC